MRYFDTIMENNSDFKVMGETVARYRWFAIFYLLFMFFLLPLYTFGLSLIGPVAIYVAFLPLLGKMLL